MIKELTTQLSEAREDYNHLKADMAAHDARLTAIEQHLSNPGSDPTSPPVTSPMDISPTESPKSSPATGTANSQLPIPNVTPAFQSSNFDERLENIDSRYNRMERALGKITNMISSFTGNSSYDSVDSQ